MKRILSCCLTLALLLSMLAFPVSAESLTGTVTVWSWDVALAHLQAQAEKFNKLHPQVKFNFEEMGVSQVYSKMTTSLQSGIGLPDLVSLEGEQMAKFGTKFPGKFVDFTDKINQKDFLPIKIGECTAGGRVIAFPWDAAPCGMFYRADLFEQAGIKAEDIVTWADFILKGKELKEKTGANMMIMALSRSDVMYRILMMQLGGFYFDAEGNTRVNSAESVRAMQLVQDLYKADIIFNDSGWDEKMTGISSGKVACVPEAVWMAGSIKDYGPEASGKWRVMPLPRFDADQEVMTASNGGSVLVVPEASKSKDAAVAFAIFAMTDVEANVEGFMKYGLYPSYIPALDNEVFSKGDEYFGGQKIYDLFKTLGEKSSAVNYTENFAETMELCKGAMSKVTTGNEDVKTVMDNLQAEMVSKFGK